MDKQEILHRVKSQVDQSHLLMKTQKNVHSVSLIDPMNLVTLEFSSLGVERNERVIALLEAIPFVEVISARYLP